MEIRFIKEKITRKELEDIIKKNHGNMVKAVVDIKREVMVLGGELHSDANEVLIGKGSNQRDVWGINIYPDRIEFASLINIRPTDNNLDMEIKNEKIKEKIRKVVNELIQ